jgi:hypothetical protein
MSFFLHSAKIRLCVHLNTENAKLHLAILNKIKRQRGGLFHPLSLLTLWFVSKGLLYDFFPAFEEV